MTTSEILILTLIALIIGLWLTRGRRRPFWLALAAGLAWLGTWLLDVARGIERGYLVYRECRDMRAVQLASGVPDAR